MIIWLASYPRSGSTLFRIVAYIALGLNTYSVYNDDVFAYAGICDIIGQLKFDRAKLWDYRNSDSVMLVKTHGSERPYENARFLDGCRAIYIARDGRDAITSFAYYQKQVGKFFGENALDGDTLSRAVNLMINKSYVRGGWCDHVITWLKRNPVIVKFRDMVADPLAAVSAALDALSVPYTIQDNHIPTFTELHQMYPQFFRSGRIGGWKDAMTDKQHERFWSIHGTAMRALGYTR